MAKPFYTLEEVSARLGKTADQVRALVRDGKLREFRDAGKVFFKAEDVDKLAGGRKADSGEIALEPTDEMPPAMDAGPGASDSITLEPIGDEGGGGADKREGTAITAKGISVFDDDELEIDTDPMAKTRISSAVGDEVPLDSAGSGSGLLDLTREADDTSLGAELLDEIYPGEDAESGAAAAPRAAAAEEPEAEEEPATAGEVIAMPIDTSYDPQEGIIGGVMVSAIVLLALGASVAGGVLQAPGFVPGYATTLANNFLYFLLGAIALGGVAAAVGWLVGKASAPRRR